MPTNKSCTNCPGATDHDTAHCPLRPGVPLGALNPEQRLALARGHRPEQAEGAQGEREAQRAALDAEFPPLPFGADQRDIDRRNADRCMFARGWSARAALAQPSPAVVQLSGSRERRIYVAGPMTGYKDFNFPAFNAQAEALRGLGYHVENPAEHGIVDGAEWQDYLRYDIGRLSTCEAIFLLPGWSKSKGAALEVHIAKALGMTFIHHADAEHEQPSPTCSACNGSGKVEFERGAVIKDCPRCHGLVRSADAEPVPGGDACPGIGGRIMAGRISKAVINKLKHHGGQLNITCDGVVVATLRLEEPALGDRDE